MIALMHHLISTKLTLRHRDVLASERNVMPQYEMVRLIRITKNAVYKLVHAAPNAGDLTSEITLAMTHGLGLKQIAATIHPYPTQTEAIRQIGDAFNRTRLTPLTRSLFARLMAWWR